MSSQLKLPEVETSHRWWTETEKPQSEGSSGKAQRLNTRARFAVVMDFFKKAGTKI